MKGLLLGRMINSLAAFLNLSAVDALLYHTLKYLFLCKMVCVDSVTHS